MRGCGAIWGGVSGAAEVLSSQAAQARVACWWGEHLWVLAEVETGCSSIPKNLHPFPESILALPAWSFDVLDWVLQAACSGFNQTLTDVFVKW